MCMPRDRGMGECLHGSTVDRYISVRNLCTTLICLSLWCVSFLGSATEREEEASLVILINQPRSVSTHTRTDSVGTDNLCPLSPSGHVSSMCCPLICRLIKAGKPSV